MINEAADLFPGPFSASSADLDSDHSRDGHGDDLVDVLSDRLQRLVERHRATQRAVQELRQALADRDRRIVELDGKLAAGERARHELVARVDALIADVEQLIAEGDSGTEGETR